MPSARGVVVVEPSRESLEATAGDFCGDGLRGLGLGPDERPETVEPVRMATGRAVAEGPETDMGLPLEVLVRELEGVGRGG